ncbi:MAG TPA: hypothetical protein VK918_02200 [Pyrinomonadaceae bacterium]|nr:hypothetical protein [Pyrinomonadaceae bacterium]
MRYALTIIFVLTAALAGRAQSTIQEFPSPIVTNAVSGSIAPRAIGDSRQTSHYYVFHGEQGDVFINVVTRNLAGTIEVFNLEGLRPMTRMVLFADSELSETGRVVYLRKPEKMLLRVQGRTPNDDPAEYTIKFAGSFAAITDPSQYAQVEPPRVTAIEAVREPDVVAESRKDEDDVPEDDRVRADAEVEAAEPVAEPEEVIDEPERPSRLEVVVTEPDLPPTKEPERTPERVEDEKVEVEEKADAELPQEAMEPEKADAVAEEKEPGQFNLVIQFRNGSKIERPMSQVLRFTIDRGTLTVIEQDGSIGRYSMREVLRVGID